VITDHHELPDELPPHVALVNPKRDSRETLRMLAGVGVAFKLAHALIKRGRDKGWPAARTIDLRAYLEWVAIGTLADVVPLTGENRILARHGMARLGQTAHPGLKALIDVSRIKGAVDSYHVGFMLAPRINAAGRMGSPDAALALFLSSNTEEAVACARALDEANDSRRQIEESILRQAISQLDGAFDPARHYGAVVSGGDWHAGVVGIVAARLCRRLQRPVVAISFAGGEAAGRGSARSIEAFDLVSGLGECADLLTGFGGHRAAAGLTIAASRLEAFRERFGEVCAARLTGMDLEPSLAIDAWVELADLDWPLHRVLEQFKPFGQGNPAPVLAARGLTIVGTPRVVGQSHLRFVAANGGRHMTAIAFNTAAHQVPEGLVDLAFTLRSNDFSGRPVLELNVEDMRATQA
jgi:single-stranded-DNA-specific exonuclease